jgi:RHS repeat-associated protein
VGQTLTFTDFDGNVTDYNTYDVLGRLTKKTIYAYTNLTSPYETVTYAYNINYTPQGTYQDTVTDSLSGLTTSTFDVNGNLIQITSPQGTVNYSYDPATGNEIEVSTTNTDTRYGYDQAGEMNTVTVAKLDGQTLASPLVTDYGYNLNGELVSTQDANGTTEARTYNALNKLTSITDSGPWGVLASFIYTYDLAGHVLSETDLNGRTDYYTYDGLYRLTKQSISDPAAGLRTLTWAYDLVGNRTSSTDTGEPTNQQSLTYVYNTNDELTSLTGSSGYGQSFTYDANGSTLTVTGTGGASSATYTWDARQRMTAASAGGNTVSDTYNDSDDRTSETVNGQTTTFLNDPNQAYDQVLEQYATGGVLAATYIRGVDLLFQDRSGARSFYVSDNLGTTRALTNSAGSVTDTYSFDAYGNSIALAGATSNPYLYAGEWLDASAGQYYIRARDYEQSLGRFTSRDVFLAIDRMPLTLNRYTYANNDSVDSSDPSGFIDGLSWRQVELQIAALYSADHPSQNVNFGGWTKLGPKGNGSAYSAKPDIFNFDQLNYLEIKPLTDSGIASSTSQMGLRSKQFKGLLFEPDTVWPWTPSLPFNGRAIVVGNRQAFFFNNGNGVLFYQEQTQQGYEELLKYVVAAHLATEAIIAIASNPELAGFLGSLGGRVAIATVRALAAAGSAMSGAYNELGLDNTLVTSSITTVGI